MKESIESIYTFYFNDIYRFLLSLSRNHHTAEDLSSRNIFACLLTCGKSRKRKYQVVAFHRRT